MKQLTIRGVPQDLARALDRERRRRGVSLNRLVLELIRQSLGLVPESRYDNGLRDHAGTWSDRQLEEFDGNTALFGQIDEELWR